MANNQKLFYTLQESSSNDFAQSDIKNALGLVEPTGEDSFGYFIANGKQYGATKTQITNIANVAANNVGATKADKSEVETLSDAVKDKANATVLNGSFTADGVEYTLSFDADNNLTLKKYQASVLSISNVSGDAISEIGAHGGSYTNTGGGEYFLGYAYSVSQSITFPTSLEVTVSVNNPNNNSLQAYAYAGVDYMYFVGSDKNGEVVNTDQTFTIDYLALSTETIVSKNHPIGYVAFKGAQPLSLEKVCNPLQVYYNDENKEVKSVEHTIKYTVSTNITCKYAYYFGEDDVQLIDQTNGSLSNKCLDAANYTINKYNSAKPSKIVIPAGGTRYLIVPNAIGTPNFINKGFPASASSFEPFTISSIKHNDVITMLGQDIEYTKYVFISNDEATINIEWK